MTNNKAIESALEAAKLSNNNLPIILQAYLQHYLDAPDKLAEVLFAFGYPNQDIKEWDITHQKLAIKSILDAMMADLE